MSEIENIIMPRLIRALDIATDVLNKFSKHVPHKNAGPIEKAVVEAYAMESRTALSKIDAEIGGRNDREIHP